MRKKKNILLIGAGMLLIVFLTACLSIFKPIATPKQNETKQNNLVNTSVNQAAISTFTLPISPSSMIQVTESQQEENLDAGSNPYPSSNVLQTTKTVDMDMVQATEIVDPIVRTRLEATNPSSVNLASGGLAFVEFFAFWCPICKSMAPVVYSLEFEYSDRIRFIYLDIDDPKNDLFKEKLGYKYQPHFFYLDAQGNVLYEWLGLVSKEEFDSILSTIQ